MERKTFIFCAVALLIGFIIGVIVVKAPLLKFDTEVNLVDLGNLLSVVCLAFLIPWLVNVKMDNKRIAKDLLMSDVANFCENLALIDQMLESLIGKQPTKEDCNKLNGQFKKVRSQLGGIETALKDLEARDAMFRLAGIKEKTTAYWEYVTGKSGVKPQNFLVNPGFLWRQSTRCEAITQDARTLKFEINRII